MEGYCDRCGLWAGPNIYIGDFLGDVVGNGGDCVDLCKDCHHEIITLVLAWWRGEDYASSLA